MHIIVALLIICGIYLYIMEIKEEVKKARQADIDSAIEKIENKINLENNKREYNKNDYR